MNEWVPVLGADSALNLEMLRAAFALREGPSLPRDVADAARPMLLRFGVTAAEFHRAHAVERKTYLGWVHATVLRARAEGDAPREALLLVLMLTLMLLDRAGGEKNDSQRTRFDEERAILDQPLAKQAFLALYEPAAGSRERRAWDAIDFERAVAIHRLGTTSVILRCRRQVGRATVALKLLLYPHVANPQISEATREYAATCRLFPDAFAPEVYASTATWILMEFVPGPTLAELVGTPDTPGPVHEGLDALERYGGLLIGALIGLGAGQQGTFIHGDLTPSNVIVHEDGSGVRVVDFGVNYLYDGSEPRRRVASFAAPEVADDGRAGPESDLFSLGQIFLYLLTRRAGAGYVHPDIFRTMPSLARLLEDLLDEHPDRRLLLHDDWRDAPDRFDRLLEEFSRTVRIARVEAASWRSRGLWHPRTWLPTRPGLRTLRRTIPAEPGIAGEPGTRWRARYEESLRWAAIAQGGHWVVSALALSALVPFLLGQDFKPLHWVVQGVGGRSGVSTPFTDAVAGTGLDRWREGFSVPWVALVVALVATRFYQAVAVPLLAFESGRVVRLAVKASVIAMPVVAVSAMVLPVAEQPWAFALAVGLFVTASSQGFPASWAGRVFREGRDVFSTIAARHESVGFPGHAQLAQWWRTNLVYAIGVTGLAAAFEAGLLRDWWVYVLGVTMVGLGIHYSVKLREPAAVIRGDLVLAGVTAERLRVARGSAGEVCR